ncbi:MAG: dockerin type I repeat-containing protein [Clostridia bacterium]|nr:dockerin type I repeat-containing protein [Clostridia bacterium]
MKKQYKTVAYLLIVTLLLTAASMSIFARGGTTVWPDGTTVFADTALPPSEQSGDASLRGDVNGDGRADSRDARLTLRAAARLVAFTEEETARADMNADGRVSAGDARTILQIAAKIRTEYDFNARYIRSFDVNEADGAPVVALFRNRSEMENFYETNKAPYSSGSALKTDAAFRDADDNYDDAFFAEHDIILIVNEESSGAYRDEIVRVTGCGGNIEVGLNRHVPGRGYGVTCDMAYWHIFVEVEKDIVPIRDVTRIDVAVQTVEGPDAPDYVYETEPSEPGTDAPEQPSTEPTRIEPTTASPTVPVAFEAQYIRTNGGYAENVSYPVVTTIKNRAELDAYYEKYKGTYDLERHERVYADTTIGFLDACDKYDDAFFAKNDLILVLTEEPSGSIRHLVRSVKTDDFGGVEIVIERGLPSVGTDDMAEWHIMVSLAKDPEHPGRDTTVSFVNFTQWDDRSAPPTEPAETQLPGVRGTQYIRTARNKYDAPESPAVHLIRSGAELEKYYNDNKEEFSFDKPFDPSPSFRDACEKYDREFFDRSDLLIVFLEEGSGSIRHEVTGVTKTPEGRQVSIRADSPRVQTCDMAYWQILIELDKGFITDEKTVTVKIEGRTNYDFAASYVRTDWFEDEISLPVYLILGSRAELDAYIDRAKEILTAKNPDYDSVGEFEKACEKYDEKYFEWQDLVLLTMSEPSGSITHKVTGVFRSSDWKGLLAAVERTVPSPQTCDAAQWHILVELEKDIVAPTDHIVVSLSTVELPSTVSTD